MLGKSPPPKLPLTPKQIQQANQKVYAPALDTNAIFNKANSSASSTVNPYYTKLLKDFVNQQAQAKALSQQQTQTNVQNLQDQLAQTLAQNQTTGERATQDTATQEYNLANDATQRQAAQGTAFDQARTTEGQSLAQRGLTGSGLGNQEQATAIAGRNTNEAQQGQADQQARAGAELSKARTFEDLATSSTNATTAEGKAVEQAKFDLNKFILGQTQDLQNEQQSLEQQRQSALTGERQKQTSLLVSNFINSISNPAQRQAAYSAYGGLL